MTLSSKRMSSKSNTATILLISLVVSAASIYAPMANAAPIYKVVDEKTGQVTFTDRPKSYEQQAGKQITETYIDTNNTSSFGNTSTASNQGNNIVSAPLQSMAATSNATISNTAKKSQANYQLIMTEPSEKRAYHRPAQSIVVNLQLRPALQVGDRVIIYLDGKEVAQGLSTSIATVDILPGAHTVKAIVENEAGRRLKQVERTIYVIQNTATLQNNKKIGQQLLAYQNLPWHQKVLLKLGQDDTNKQQSSNQ
ncbi:archaellum component FlaF (FlaF/FlaG flagellin family) [Psychrobacter sp. PL19]|uniref:DUF4124 domain-containing protein n=1 Tax=Psychrobacter sp. PL19 TaxID=2760711 RepID=UPI001AE671E3